MPDISNDILVDSQYKNLSLKNLHQFLFTEKITAKI